MKSNRIVEYKDAKSFLDNYVKINLTIFIFIMPGKIALKMHMKRDRE